jgi:hypothetical protein
MVDEVHVYKRAMELGDEAIEQYVLHPRTNEKLKQAQTFYSEDEDKFVEEFLKYKQQSRQDTDNKPRISLSVPDEVQEEDNGVEWHPAKIDAKELYDLVKSRRINKIHVYKRTDEKEKYTYYLIHPRRNGELEKAQLFTADREEGYFVKVYNGYEPKIISLSVPDEVPRTQEDTVLQTKWYNKRLDKEELEDIIKANSFK